MATNRNDNRFCTSDRCNKTTQPHAVKGNEYTCKTCGNVKHRAGGLAWTPQPALDAILAPKS